MFNSESRYGKTKQIQFNIVGDNCCYCLALFLSLQVLSIQWKFILIWILFWFYLYTYLLSELVIKIILKSMKLLHDYNFRNITQFLKCKYNKIYSNETCLVIGTNINISVFIFYKRNLINSGILKLPNGFMDYW